MSAGSIGIGSEKRSARARPQSASSRVSAPTAAAPAKPATRRQRAQAAAWFSESSYALPPHEQAVIEAARSILDSRLRGPGKAIDTPGLAKELARLHLAGLRFECFSVFFFDCQNRLIALERVFRGTLTQTAVYPREIVVAALRHSAAAVVFAHNHPSGAAEPSRADEYLTQSLKGALALVDVCVLDHLVVGEGEVVSFAERGLL